MRVSFVRSLLCWLMVIVVPVAALGQAPSAILHTQGGVWVNGYEAVDSSAIFSGDLLETKPGFAATLTLDGTSVLIQAESVTKFQGDFLVLDHGSVAVETFKSFKVKVNCLTVVPVVNDLTKYEVTDVNGTVRVAARKLDVNVEREQLKKPSAESTASQGGSVHEGEEKSYQETAVCGAPPEPVGPGRSMNPKWIAAGAGGGGLLICLLVCFGHGGGTKPVSPANP